MKIFTNWVGVRKMLSEEIVQVLCGICKENSSCDFVTRCGHWFHEFCLKTWFNSQISCPYCRQSVSKSKNAEKIRWNLKKLKVNETKANAAINFFDSYLKPPVDRYYSRGTVPSYDIEIIKTLINFNFLWLGH